MKDIGSELLAKKETILDNWIDAVRRDAEIDSAKSLAYQSVKDSLPFILEAIASLLNKNRDDDKPQQIERESLEHGLTRAEQGYDAAEIVREYRLLRQVIFTVLEPALLTGSGREVLETVKTIDTVLDKVIAISLESYVEARVNEVKQVQNQLMLTNQELTRLVESQKDNLSHLAHELKNPLNAIVSFSTLLLQQQQKSTQEPGNTLNLQTIERVLNNGQQLLRLINNALEVSRYESDRIELNLKPVEVKTLIQDITNALETSIGDKEIEVILDCANAPETIISDPLRLRQIISNLVSNALRYTERGKIEITCSQPDESCWVFSVSDTGRGISLEDRQQIFEPFYRVGSQEDYLPQSTGLGLAIVNKLVKLFQGQIELQSELGKGSAFTVTLPQKLQNQSS
ncbi:sensor histidine kinase [Myxosarcina sp. GI1]|uniref:sensor histidine kinase n=1 Tax=Myxosarcina sp. GI1 TaxID=1541065 RepID=UPI00055B1EAE|nr:sensor histidine kinase [Myxosarcina sp. GI1]